MLDAGFARILLPNRIGGYGLGFDTWFEVMRELSKADASHGWCAGLIIHHAHLIAQYPEEAQKTLWANSLDVPVAASFAPNAQAVPADGGYHVSGKGSPFASGVDHSSWVMLGGMAQDEGGPEWKFFLVAPGDYTVRDTWNTAGMTRHRQQHDRHRQRLRAAQPRAAFDGFARRQNAGQRHV